MAEIVTYSVFRGTSDHIIYMMMFVILLATVYKEATWNMEEYFRMYL